MASIAAALLAVLGVGAALVKRETTNYGQHVETSLLEALLFLNAGAIFRLERHRPRVFRPIRTPIVHTYPTSDGRYVQTNLSGTERWRELCRLVDRDDGDLDFSDPASIVKLVDKEWLERTLDDISSAFASRTADEWEQALLEKPAAAAKCNTLEEWLEHEQLLANELLDDVDEPAQGPLRLVGSPIRIRTDATGRCPKLASRRGRTSQALARPNTRPVLTRSSHVLSRQPKSWVKPSRAMGRMSTP